MRVLHVIASVDPRGGGPIEAVFSTSGIWHEAGHQTHIVSLDDPDAPWVKDSGVPTIGLGVRGGFYSRVRRLIPLLRYGYSPHLTRWLNSNAGSYDAIVVHGLWNYASLGSWRVLKGSASPYFVFPHGMLDPWFAQVNPLKHLLKKAYWLLFERKVIRDAAGVLFTCREEASLASSAFPSFEAKSFVVGFGTRDVGGDPGKQLEAFFTIAPDTRDRRLLLFMGRIHPKKGIDLVIRGLGAVADEFPDVDLVVAGPDQVGLRTALQALANDLGVGSRVHWTGMLTADAKWGAFRASEFLVLPSHQESFGIVVAEALALSTPVLITNKVNIWEEVEADGAGFVVSDNEISVGRGIRKLCLLDFAARSAMGLKARHCFVNRYDMQTNAIEMLALIDRLNANGR